MRYHLIVTSCKCSPVHKAWYSFGEALSKTLTTESRVVHALAGRKTGLRVTRDPDLVVESLDEHRVFTTLHLARTGDLALVL